MNEKLEPVIYAEVSKGEEDWCCFSRGGRAAETGFGARGLARVAFAMHSSTAWATYVGSSGCLFCPQFRRPNHRQEEGSANLVAVVNAVPRLHRLVLVYLEVDRLAVAAHRAAC
jgi:hypothetical protein